MSAVRMGVASALLLATAGPLDSQGPPELVRRAAVSPLAGSAGGAPFISGPMDPDSAVKRPLAPGTYFLLSALAPGWGQYLLAQGRWAPYAALEGWAWLQYLDRRREGRRLEVRYRELAWLVARRDFAPGFRIDGSFEYYEAMSQYRRSGLFDRDPLQAGIQPEEDPDTFNGTVWLLARQIFLGGADSTGVHDPTSPAYQKALAYYRSRAYSLPMAWDWGPFTLHWMEYKDLIRASDESLRRATNVLGLILGNHLLSSVDALVSARLRELAGGRGLEMRTLVFSTQRPLLRWAFEVRISHGGRW